jgi:23S rRNA (guanine745-N1)-methyltransferase
VIPLVCTVRGCAQPLAPAADERSLRCPRGHAFDRARGGYWNLLQPQDRRSAKPGDSATAVAARRRWLERGFAASLAAELKRLGALEALVPTAVAVDLGCGEGTLLAELTAGASVELLAIDLSIPAIRLAARKLPRATCVVANADRRIPLADASADVALSLFGRRPAAELGRVVRRGGRLIVAVPAAEDLVELREAVQGPAEPRERLGGAIEDLAPAFVPLARGSWKHRVFHDAAACRDALAMTYRGARRAEAGRVQGLAGMELTLAADLALLIRR